MAGQRRDNLVGDGFDIERFGRCSHARILSEALEGANGCKGPHHEHVCPFLAHFDVPDAATSCLKLRDKRT